MPVEPQPRKISEIPRTADTLADGYFVGNTLDELGAEKTAKFPAELLMAEFPSVNADQVFTTEQKLKHAENMGTVFLALTFEDGVLAVLDVYSPAGAYLGTANLANLGKPDLV